MVFRKVTGQLGAEVNTEAASEEPVQLNLDKKYFRKGPSRKQTIIETIVVFVLALIVAVGVKTYLYQSFYIPSVSMERTLLVGDRLLVSKRAYVDHGPKRGDIIVFERPAALEDDDSKIKDLIKRVIAVPGDEVIARDGKVFINGTQIDESAYLYPEGVATSWNSDQPVKLGENQYWVMGDNRGMSKDSRYFGPIENDIIVGKAVVRFFPFYRIGSL